MKRLICHQLQSTLRRVKCDLHTLPCLCPLQSRDDVWGENRTSSCSQINRSVLGRSLRIYKRDRQFFKTFESGVNTWQAASSVICWTDTSLCVSVLIHHDRQTLAGITDMC